MSFPFHHYISCFLTLNYCLCMYHLEGSAGKPGQIAGAFARRHDKDHWPVQAITSLVPVEVPWADR